MSALSLEITTTAGTSTQDLKPGLTRVGAPGAPGIDIAVEGAGGELHIWDSPPKVVRVQGDDALIVDGDMHEEALIHGGSTFAWSGAKFRVHAAAPVLEEIVEPKRKKTAARPQADTPAGRSSIPGAPTSPEAVRAWQRLSAGLLVEVGLADKAATKRWQAAVVQKEWDADACARDVLGATDPSATSDGRFVERAGRLERDLLMSSFQRGIKGASRRMRGAAKNTTAMIFANLMALGVYSAIILALLILARVKYEWSLDGIIDRMISAVSPGS